MDMAAFHQGLHDSMDDGAEHKAMHRRMSQHHAELATIYKGVEISLGGESSNMGPGGTGDLHGPEVRKATDLRPDGVAIGYSVNPPAGVRLVPRGGYNGG